jgi:hypothetical protein
MVSPIGHAILLPSHFAVGKERAGVYLRWGGVPQYNRSALLPLKTQQI